MLTEEIKQRREKGRGREWQFEEKAARPAELEESVEVNKETLRSVLMISAKEAKLKAKKRKVTSSLGNFRNQEASEPPVMKESSLCLCVLLKERLKEGRKDKKRKGSHVKVGKRRRR